MDDYWNISDTSSSTLNFFDEDNNIQNIEKCDIEKKVETSNTISSCIVSQPKQRIPRVSSNLDNFSTSASASVVGYGGVRAKEVGKSLGEKIETWKYVSLSKLKNEGSEKCLQCTKKEEELTVLKNQLERSYSRQYVTLSASDTIEKMVSGLSYSLENYKMFEDKIRLLDLAVEANDTSTIVAILVFMKNTLKSHIFYKELEKCDSAYQAFVTHLKRRKEYSELFELFKVLNRSEEITILKYELAITSAKENRLKNLKSVKQTYFENNSDLPFEQKTINAQISLLEKQNAIEKEDRENSKSNQTLEKNSLLNRSLLTTLYYSSMYHWNDSSSKHSPIAFKKEFEISDKQFLWTVIRARAKMKHWPVPSEIESLITAKGVVGTISALSGRSGSGKLLKKCLPIEIVIDTLANSLSPPPPNVLSHYIDLVSSQENRLQLAKTYHCNSILIETYAKSKDKTSLEELFKTLSIGSPDHVKADIVLKNTKW